MAELNLAALQPGDALPPLVKKAVSEVQLVRYAGASGDFNPLHYMDSVGKMAGFDGVIAHGMLIMAFAGQALTQWFGPAALRRFKVRFVGVTKPGDIITVQGQIREREERDGQLWLQCTLTATGQDGAPRLKGECLVVCPLAG
ncbi:MAG: MaoC/PaaZ C-terminal domain-containing protein [Bacillota bacterium]|uniref:MaoC/PaaZ C-terminal domain-containing protein n=1 Tax=Desulfurispora thermophila TaxID=265470 RepID=UPI0003776FFA|nr:MaoC/PaaZ C-terminal domain-containing protein [Desulfurispora thermophila]